MFAWLRLALILLVLMAVVHVSLAWYFRSLHREELEREYEEHGRGDRETFIEAGMQEYERSLQRRLLWGVYIIPFAAIAVLIYLVNFR